MGLAPGMGSGVHAARPMGIDIYMRWKYFSEEDRKAQITGFRIDCGHTGYLREAYHGNPYATKTLLPECFSEDQDGKFTEEEVTGQAPEYPEDEPYRAYVRYPNGELRRRLPEALEAARQRCIQVYKQSPEEAETDDTLKSLRDFVNLYESKEREGLAPAIYASY